MKRKDSNGGNGRRGKKKNASSERPPAIREYAPGAPFSGVIGRTLDESSPAWPSPARAREGAPNVILFVLDDVGFGQLTSFGGLVSTPNLDRLAESGLRYASFHTTALCSPTRGCLMTGRNHHTLGMSAITELSLGFPAHNAYMGFEHGFLPEMLREHGYNTFALGKWHLTPPAETTTAGPFSRWPLGRGFERYYGFLGGDTDQWFPDLTQDNHPVRPPRTPEEGYHLNIDLADKAIEFIQDAHVNAPEKPFFLYYATGAGHAPHQVEREWADKYRGCFDMGWDEYREQVHARQLAMGIIPPGTKLSARDPDVEAWDSLSPDAKRLYARQMEVYAGFIEQTDHHFGRVLRFIERIGELDNTLVIALSDNGASAEGGDHGTFNEMLFFNGVAETLEDNLARIDEWGGPDTFNHYSWGWAWAGNTPFRRWKRETFRGGVADPCIVCWPKSIQAGGEVRAQYIHAIDILPTVLDALGLEPPTTIRGVTQSPLQGVSFAHTFANGTAATRRHAQYFEMFGHRAIYHDGWRAVCPWPGASLAEAKDEGRPFGLTPLDARALADLDAHSWMLFNVAEDPSETRDLAGDNPNKLAEMIQRWYTEAGTYGVLPLAAADLQRMNVERPSISRPRMRHVYYAGGSPIAFAAMPRTLNRPFSITADVTIPPSGAEGILLTQGSRNGGFAFYVQDRRLHHIHNYLGLTRFELSSPDPVADGRVTLRYEFEPTGKPDFATGKGAPGRGQLYVNGKLVAVREYPYTVPNIFGTVGASCGYAAYDSVAPDLYQAPFRFTGEIAEVVLDLSGELIVDSPREIERLMIQQ